MSIKKGFSSTIRRDYNSISLSNNSLRQPAYFKSMFHNNCVVLNNSCDSLCILLWCAFIVDIDSVENH